MADGSAIRKYAPKTEVWMRPDCPLLTWRTSWKCLFRTSSIAWQKPQMKKSEATIRKAKRSLFFELFGESVSVSVRVATLLIGAPSWESRPAPSVRRGRAEASRPPPAGQ